MLNLTQYTDTLSKNACNAVKETPMMNTINYQRFGALCDYFRDGFYYETDEQLHQAIENSSVLHDRTADGEQLLKKEALWIGKQFYGEDNYDFMCHWEPEAFEIPRELSDHGEVALMCLWALISNSIPKEALPRALTAPLYQPDVLLHLLYYLPFEEADKLFEYLPPIILSNTAFMKKVILVKSSIAQYAPPKIWEDREWVMRLFQRDGFALCYAPDRIRNDEAFVYQAVLSNGCALNYASERLKDNKKIVTAAVDNTYALQYASPRLRDQEDIALIAARGGSNGFYPSKRLCSDGRFMIDCIMLGTRPSSDTGKRDYFRSASPNLQQNRAFILECAKRCGRDIANKLPPSFRTDADVQQMFELHENRFGQELENVLQDFVRESHIPEWSFLTRPEYRGVLGYAFFASHPEAFLAFPDYRDDWKLMRFVVSVQGNMLGLASEALRDSWEIVSVAVENDPSALRFASPRLRKHPQIQKKANHRTPKITYFDLSNGPRSYDTPQFTRNTAYYAEWDQNDQLPKPGETRSVHISSSFSVRLNTSFFLLYGIKNPFGIDSPEGILFVQCKLVGSAYLPSDFFSNNGPTLIVEITRVWTAEEMAKEVFQSDSLRAPYFTSSDNTEEYDKQFDNWSVEGFDVDGVDEKIWYIYTDQNQTDHVLLYRCSDGYRTSFQVGNLILGNRMERKAKKYNWTCEYNSHRYLYAGAYDKICILKYLQDDEHEIAVPGKWDRPPRSDYPYDYSSNDENDDSLSIGEEAFQQKNNLEIVTLPNNVRKIERFAFRDCKNLKRVYIPGHTTILQGAFDGCSPELTLVVRQNSPQHRFALENGIRFECIQ